MRRLVEQQRGAGLARKALLARRSRLAALAAGLKKGEDDVGRTSRPDQLDRASDIETHAVLGRLQAVEARELAEIDAALRRIAMGTYGHCERCASPVGDLRLRAVPEARLCMACAGSR